jgi:oxygen-independent coproporphyrinogen-3 oxidase
MHLVLVGYDSNYEIEQLTRMFFKPLEVSVCQSRDRNIKIEFIYIRKHHDKFFIYVNYNGKKEYSYFAIEKQGEKQDMQLCIAAYKLYVNVTGKTLPWGVLTGVRPVRLVRNLYGKYGNINSVTKKLENTYLVTDEKIKLRENIFNLQKPFIENRNFNDYSLYVSIPFCPSRCSYCSFVSVSVKSAAHLMEDYVDNLCVELRQTAKIAKELGMNLNTVYIGGGTPTAISHKQLEKLMKCIRENFDFSALKEYTVEAGRPDCTDIKKLEIIKGYGAGRISVNPQSFNDNVLKAIGRNHTTSDFLRCVNDARKVGFDTINMDLIAGLPLDTVESFEKSIKSCINLKAENITVHTLTLKRASNLVIEHEEYDYADVENMLGKTKLLYDSGYFPYYMYRQKASLKNLENVGFSHINHENLYNIYTMEEVQTIVACGAGGVSKVVGPKGEIKRIANYKYPAEYLKNFSNVLKRKQDIFSTWQNFYSPCHTNK